MSINLNGSSQYLERTSSLTFLPLTISVWFKTNSTTTAQTLVAQSATTAQGRHTFYIDTDSKLKAATVDSSGLFGSIAASSASVTTDWNHGVAYFASNSSRTVYLNGTGASATTSPSPTVSSQNRFNIGCRYAASTTPGVYFNGLLAEVAVWNVQLTDAEILSLSKGTHPFSIRLASLFAYWPVGGFYGSSPNDYSSGGRNMTEVGTPTYSDHPNIQYPQPIFFFPESVPAQSITIDAISSLATIYNPTIVSIVDIALPNLTSTTSVYQPDLTQSGIQINLPVIASSAVVYQPQITPGSVNVSVPIISLTTIVQQPTLQVGAVNVSVPTISSNTTVFQPTVNVGTVNIAAPLITANITVHQPEINAIINVALPNIAATTTVYEPQVNPGTFAISLEHITAITNVYGPAVTTGKAIVLDNIASNTTVYNPTITPGSINISAPVITSTTTVYSPEIAAQPINISLPNITSQTVVYQPQIELKLQIITLDKLSSLAVVREPDLSGISTDTSDVLTSTKKKRRKTKEERVAEQIIEENIAAQILRSRQNKASVQESKNKESVNLQINLKQNVPNLTVQSLVSEMPIKEAVNIGAIVDEFKQKRNKQLKVLLLMSAMEM